MNTRPHTAEVAPLPSGAGTSSSLPAGLAADTPRFEPLAPDHLDAVCAIESRAHRSPWQKRHFEDCLSAGYLGQGLWRGADLLGFLVAMHGLDEVHVLNLCVDPPHQRQGWGATMMGALALWAVRQRLQTLWLEVRESNRGAIALYKGLGLRVVGVRKGYYPNGPHGRENAWVMRGDLSQPWPDPRQPSLEFAQP